MRHLRLQPGQTVLDVACGTGQNFDLFLEQIGPEGCLLGLDYSTGMLRKAQERLAWHGWSSEQVQLHGRMLRAMAAGETAKLPLKNSGSVEHQLGIAEIPLVTQGGGMAGHNMAGMDGTMAPEAEQLQVHLVAALGATTSLELTPTQAGEYAFRCVAPGHTEQGTLVVTR